MLKVIDHLDTVGDWTTQDVTISINEHQDFIRSGTGVSLAIENAGISAQITRVVSVIDPYPLLSLGIWGSGEIVLTLNTHVFRFEGPTVMRAFMKIYKLPWTFDEDITSVKIEFSEGFRGIISGLYSVQPDYPLDIYNGLKELFGGIELHLGQAATAAGQTHTLLDLPNLSRYCCLRFEGTSGIETHVVKDINLNEKQCSYLSNYDGDEIVYTQTAQVYLVYLPVVGMFEQDAIIPGIAIWGFPKLPIQDDNFMTERFIGTIDGEAVIVTTEKAVAYNINVELDAHRYGELADMNQDVSRLMQKSTVWVNRERYRVDWEQMTSESSPTDPIDIIPKEVYNVEVEVRDLWQFQVVTKATTVNLSLDVV